MPRFYFDSNIYRYLKKDEDNSLSKLEEFIKTKDNSHVFFSSAHLFDLGRDKTNLKYDDLRFMEQFTERNYMHLSNDEEFATTTLATPSEAFETMITDPFESAEYNEIVEVLKGNVDDPEIRRLMDNVFNIPIGSDYLGVGDLDE